MSDNNIKIIADKVEIDDIAEAVREKTGKTEKMSLGDIARNVRGMSEAGTALDLDEEITTQEGLIDQIQIALEGKANNNGIDTSDATIESGAQMLKDITAYGANGKITGTIPSQTGRTITPTESVQTAISAGTYAEGDITISAIPNEYVVTTDADATAGDITKDKTAYVNGVKVVGTHECSSGGETSYSTCALSLTNYVFTGNPLINYTAINNGVIESKQTTYRSSIQNVLCGSIAVLEPPVFQNFIDCVITVDGEEVSFSEYHCAFIVPNKENETINIVIDVSDSQ